MISEINFDQLIHLEEIFDASTAGEQIYEDVVGFESLRKICSNKTCFH